MANNEDQQDANIPANSDPPPSIQTLTIDLPQQPPPETLQLSPPNLSPAPAPLQYLSIDQAVTPAPVTTNVAPGRDSTTDPVNPAAATTTQPPGDQSTVLGSVR
jgi:hypothetical protein